MKHYLAFDGHKALINANLLAVARCLKAHQESGNLTPVLIFDDDTGRQMDIDISGSDNDLSARFDERSAGNGDSAEVKPAKRGRPKLGVIGREVTLLPRHWEWLDSQRGGASGTLRRLVDQARKQNSQADVVRSAQDSTNRFISAIAGDLPGFEDATRALYSGNEAAFKEQVKHWPKDVRKQALKFADGAF